MRAHTIVAVTTGCLLAALAINLVVQLNINDRPLTCPYCAFQHKHNLQHQFHTPSFLYASAMTRHANFHVFDEYSLTHFSHGLLEAAFCCLIAFSGCCCSARHTRPRILLIGFICALIIETTWEFLENRPQSLKYYDFKNQQYCGDSGPSNSNFDILSMATGFGVVILVANMWQRFLHHTEQWKRDQPTVTLWRHKIKHHCSHLPTWAMVILFASTLHTLSELYLFHTIKDGLMLSTVEFLWHASGKPVPTLLLWTEAERTKLLIAPGARCHQLLARA